MCLRSPTDFIQAIFPSSMFLGRATVCRPGCGVGARPSTVLFQNVSTEHFPVSGATVTLDSGDQDPPATTSAAAFYMVCSVVGTDQTRTITARKDGYRMAAREIFGGWTSGRSRTDARLKIAFVSSKRAAASPARSARSRSFARLRCCSKLSRKAAYGSDVPGMRIPFRVPASAPG